MDDFGAPMNVGYLIAPHRWSLPILVLRRRKVPRWDRKGTPRCGNTLIYVWSTRPSDDGRESLSSGDGYMG